MIYLVFTTIISFIVMEGLTWCTQVRDARFFMVLT